ncbi:MAG: isochorismate synthase [Cyanobacteria bacterium K_DeepCast_150m_m2_101]|nr:isochorismate synthase [Cyanobacteria bacterium K_DeepCast_150m_m2_101]
MSSRFSPPRVQAPSSVTTSFSDLLAAAADGARQLDGDGVLSLALPLTGRDPMALLSQLEQGDRFRFLWDSAPGLCLAASGRCNSLELSGPRRFELAQRFSSVSLGRLAAPQHCPPLARPRVLLAFSFFDSPLQEGEGVPGVQAVLPRWQLSRQGRHCWLRLQRTLGGDVSARSLAEELWEQAARLAQLPADPCAAAGDAAGPAVINGSAWQEGYRSVVERGLDLVEAGELRKLVLAVRQQLQLAQPLDPLRLLAQLRERQPGSCRFLWQRADGPALLGASPERLLTVRQGQLRSDALAGTAPVGPNADQLLHSDKDRREHELVVEAITAVLQQSGLTPRRPRHPRLARHGQLMHLHTPITAALGDQQPLAVAAALHPTPAVAGLPRREAMAALRSLEPFERGYYAAPIGWIDSEGDTELRVAIRSGSLQGQRLELTAGAGLVPGSAVERELAEVALKLGVLQQQLDLPHLNATP